MAVSEVTIWMDRITLYLALCNSVILFLILLVQLIQNPKTKQHIRLQTRSNAAKIMSGFALGTLLSSIIYTTQRIISVYGIGNCNIHLVLAASLWMTAKVNMYLFFICRLHVAFNDSMFKFSNTLFFVLYSIVVIAYISDILVYVIWGSGTKLYDNNSQPFCANSSPLWTLMYSAVCDLIISSLLCYLFVKRLFKAFFQCQELDKSKVLITISRIAKYITLTVIGVNTTFFALLFFGILKWFTFIALDLILNGWCVFLIYSKNKKLFNVFCGICHRGIGKCFYKCIQCTKAIDSNSTQEKSQFLEVYEYGLETKTNEIPSQSNETFDEERAEITSNAISKLKPKSIK
eukprot:264531_1